MKDLSQSEELALAIGKVTMAWNGAHEVLLRIFSHVTGMKPDIAESVFLGRRSDRDQRQMLIKAAELAFVEPADVEKLRELRGYIEALDKLAKSRNAAVHTMWHGLFLDYGSGFKVVMQPRSSTAKDVILRIGQPVRDYSLEFRELAAKVQTIGISLFDFYGRLEPEGPPWVSVDLKK